MLVPSFQGVSLLLEWRLFALVSKDDHIRIAEMKSGVSGTMMKRIEEGVVKALTTSHTEHGDIVAAPPT